MGIKGIRIFPPLAVARLGSSPIPLENYDLKIPDAVSLRKIVPAPTFLVDDEGNLTETLSAGPVAFRDGAGLIHPVAPFFEVWVQLEGSDDWTQLTKQILADHGANADAVVWNVSVGNHKVFAVPQIRRTASMQ
jgi:hypothetical protein